MLMFENARCTFQILEFPISNFCYSALNSFPLVSGSTTTATIISRYADSENTAIAAPSEICALRYPTSAGNSAPMPRPKLYEKPCPEPRTRLGYNSVRNDPIGANDPEAKNPRGNPSASM